MQKERNKVNASETYLGIELGSTRIKAVLIDADHQPLASGSHTWENQLENGLWTYALDDIWNGVRDCYAKLCADVHRQYGMQLETVGAIGVSAMMHGYMAFDKGGTLLVPFRIWRNTNTGAASEQLTTLFGFNVPHRWSIAHLYQAIIDGEEHVPDIDYLTTLAGYIHWQLTGEKVLGIGDASGMFPIDDATRSYDAHMQRQFNTLAADRQLPWTINRIMPKVLSAGEPAGVLSAQGSKRLDPTGRLKAGIPMCPPEGDAGTGMVATNSVRQRSGNVSAGTSVFAMVVLENPLSKVYPEIDMVTTPVGDPVAMVHCNNFLSDIDAWVNLLGDAAAALGAQFDIDTLYSTLYSLALEGDADCGGLMTSNYISGEPITGFSDGCPLFMRSAEASLSLPNFMRAHLCSACATLKIGMDILFEEQVQIDAIIGHGGFFKVPGVGQRIMAAALGTSVKVMATASEGGPWGMAILAAYMNRGGGVSLADYMSQHVFVDAECAVVQPQPEEQEGIAAFMARYKASLAVEQAAVDALHH